jgi:hypothetical protein
MLRYERSEGTKLVADTLTKGYDTEGRAGAAEED